MKIDKSFVDTIGTNSITSEVVFHIIALGKSLGMKLVAEGVEKPEQIDILRSQGVESVQGWIFSKPMNISDLNLYLEKYAYPG